MKKKRIGPMTMQRKRETQPSYVRVLQRFGLLAKNADIQVAWSAWQRVCSDHEVIRLSMVKASKNQPAFMASVTEPFRNAAQVLAAMTDKQLSALRQRIQTA